MIIKNDGTDTFELLSFKAKLWISVAGLTLLK